MIIIAHRVSTLKNVDRIIVFSQGKIVEEGTYDSLSANHSSEFSKIYNLEKRKKIV